MKKLLTFMLCICAASMCYAQLKVYSSGVVGIARDTISQDQSFMTIGNGGYYLSNYRFSLFSTLQPRNGTFNIGIQSIVNNSSPLGGGRAFGLLGLAGNSTDKYNYGVLGGILGNQNGAGIFGTTSNYGGVAVNGRYAGYFDGPTKVSGNLTVTGSIDGVLLGHSADGHSLQTTSLENNTSSVNISTTLSGLTAIAYYKEQPTMSLTERNDTASTTTMATFNQFESQNLSKKQYALSATQLAELYPDLVYENEDGTKMINYVGMIPLLVQSIGELKAEIAELKGSNAKTRSYNSATDIDGLETIDVASLSQNSPNPFTTATNIEMLIPSEASTALFCIYDMSGKQVKQNVIHERGKTTLNVASEGLSAGMYLYSLIIDGKVIDTRRMILTK